MFVVRLLGLRIHAPLRRLKVGNTMPLYAVGVTSEAETPHAFGSANPALSFSWSINSKQVRHCLGDSYSSGSSIILELSIEHWRF